MKIKLKRYIAFCLLVIIAFVFGIAKVSQAYSVNYTSLAPLIEDGANAIGKTLGTVGRGNQGTKNNINVFSKDNENIYCVNHGATLRENNIYTVKMYIEIKGKDATIKGNSIEETKTYNDDNAKLAYILGGGNSAKGYGTYYNGGETTRQYLVWYNWNNWAKENIPGGKKFTGWNPVSNWMPESFRTGIKQYIDELNNSTTSEAYIKSLNKEVASSKTSDNKQLIGPIKLKFEGTLSLENSSGFEFYNSDKQKMQNGIKDVKTEQAFYIKTNSNNSVSKLKFYVTSSKQGVINARIWIIENSWGRQRLIIADTNTEPTNSSDSVEITVNNQEDGNLKIHKQDKSSQKALTGAKFKINVGTNKDNLGSNWVGIDSLGLYKYDVSYEDAKEFEVDKNGDLEIKNLKVGTNITVYETKAPEGYDLTKQPGYDEKLKAARCNSEPAKISKADAEVTIKVDNSKTGNIEITKQDTTTKEKLTGAGFKVSVKEAGNKDKNIWLKQNDDKTYSYTSSFKDATEFKVTDENNGIYQIKDLDPQKYFIYEVTAPKGYDITSQEKYDSKNQWVDCGSTDVESGNVTKVTLDNTRNINLEGYVWIEKPGSKANEYNDIFDIGAEKDDGEAEPKTITDKVKIMLRAKAGDIIVAENPIIKEENGKIIYRFEKIDYNKLKDYYVEFDYSEKYKNYITVSPKFDVAEGSKAISDKVLEKDKDLVGKACTYRDTADEAKYGLSYLATKFFNEKTYTLENVNLGIKELPETPFTVSENLAYVDAKLKGYNYRYIYGGTGAKIQTVPTVKWQSKTDKECYTREIYPADILYENPADKTQELQVYVTYRIDVTNNTNIDVPYLYQEKSLNVKRVLNKFDTNRYELADDNWEKTESADVVMMKNEYVQKQYYDANKNGISNEKDKNNKYAFITFRIKDERIKELLTKPEGTIEDFPTTAQVTAYHEYTRIDASWENNLTKTQTHYTREDSKRDSAPYLITGMSEKNRTISGKVFEDKNSKTNGELVGNGMYDQNENKVQSVIVELGNYDANKQFVPTQLYEMIEVNNQRVAKTDENGNLIKAVTRTDADGKYKFEGVVPGEYFLRYTYGDGTQEIVSANGNKKVSSDKYKSTIVTEEIKKVYETSYEATKATWYLGLGENHNIAVDDLKQRAELSKNKYVLDVTNPANSEANNISAETPEFSVPIEFTDKTEGLATEQYPKELGYMDFGIIEIPNTRIGIDKKITNIKLTYQNGQVAIDGNPATQNLAYTTDLDKKTNGGSKYVKVELDSEYIYDGTLEIKYEIEVSNDSDIDYIEKEGSNTYGYYYKYGIITKDAHEKTIKIEDAIDYLDPKLAYKSKEGELDLKEINVKEFRNNEASSLTAEQKRILALVKAQESASGKQFDKILQLTGMGELNSSKGNNNGKSSKKITINAEKILSSQEDDLEFINVAEVTKIEVEPMTPANVAFVSSSANATQKIAFTPNVTITVTPSTGEDRSLLYLATGTIALAIVAGGIAIIKKKVL